MSTRKYDVVIFDCDGTIADSEYMNCMACAMVLQGLGYERYSLEVVYTELVGMTLKAISEVVSEEYDIPMVEDFTQRIVDKVVELTPEYLKEVPGVSDAVKWAHENFKICVASNGEPTNVNASVDVLDLRQYFPKDMVFTQAQVKFGKPAPDLFLLAANHLGGIPERTLVVEDTTVGVRAAKAAGMDVIGYTKLHSEDVNYESKLRAAGADFIMSEWSEFKEIAG